MPEESTIPKDSRNGFWQKNSKRSTFSKKETIYHCAIDSLKVTHLEIGVSVDLSARLCHHQSKCGHVNVRVGEQEQVYGNPIGDTLFRQVHVVVALGCQNCLSTEKIDKYYDTFTI